MIKRIVNWMRKKRQLSGKGKAPSRQKMPCRQKLSPSNNTASTPTLSTKTLYKRWKKFVVGDMSLILSAARCAIYCWALALKILILPPTQRRRRCVDCFVIPALLGGVFVLCTCIFTTIMKPKIMEVSTFRAGDDSVCEESGRVLRDNYFGDAASDAWRRDFCVNALFYNPHTGDILDYVGGYADVSRRRLRVIGKPAVRFRQDPVRVLRALRISAKLNLSMAGVTQRALIKYSRCWLTSRPPDCLMSLLRP